MIFFKAMSIINRWSGPFKLKFPLDKYDPNCPK